jgi:nucleoside 2-deoxyribosyltransferase
MTSRTILTLANGRGLDLLRAFPLVYLATPYSKYAAGIECAFKDAAALTGKLLTAGIKIYSPIAHTHPIAIYGNLDPLDHSIWMPFDEAMMTASSALLVAQMQGWRESYGVNYEIGFFLNADKPVFYLDTVLMRVAAEPMELN